MAASPESARAFSSTYRLQLNGSFGFRAAARAVPYLARLGSTVVYTSPILASVPGGHGYDTVNPTRLEPSLGSARDFETFWTELRRHAMGLLVDVVPNH